MASKDEIKKRLKQMYGNASNDLAGVMLGLAMTSKGKVEKNKNVIIQAFVALAVPMIIFFPFNLQSMVLWLLGILALVILIAVAVAFFIKSEGALPIRDFLFSAAFLLFLVIVTQFLNCGSQACFWVVSTRIGTTMTTIAFLALEGICVMIGLMASRGVFFLSMVVIVVLLFALIPFLSPKNYYGFCKNIPGLSGSEWCKSREVTIESLKTVKIPVSGGISVKIETPRTLYAGDPYQYTFILTNYYERDITFELKPSIVSSYGTNINFVQPYTQKTDSLKPKEYYQDIVKLIPEEMTIEEGTCPYSTQQIAAAHYIHLENVTCSVDKPCENSKEVCAKLDTFECGCVDWTKATCSKNSLRAKVSVTHSAFFLGNASLYYSNDITSPAYGTELTQGPLSVIVEFQPNPYIASIDQHRDTVSMYVTFKNHGGEIDIKNFKATPQNTVIHTIDKEKQMELIEEVGTEVVSCRDISEILQQTLSSGAEVGGKLCDLKPPSVKTTLINLQTNTTTEVNDVTYPFLTNYCSKTKVSQSDTSSSTNWDKIYSAIDTSGLCEILNKKDSGDNQIVQDAMAHVNVLIELEYSRKIGFYSDEVVPYTRTDKCCELIQKNGGSCWTTSTT
jgi:hypothetical protein